MKSFAKPYAWRLGAVLLLVMVGCASGPDIRERQATAMRMWQERCDTRAGVRIYRTEENVEGIFLMKLRPNNVNFGNQFSMDDPYGRDVRGEGYMRSFLKGGDNDQRSPQEDLSRLPKGYRYVDAVDPNDGRRYRYTGRIEEPWQTDKSYLKGYTRFVLKKAIAPGPLPRYGVTYEDISTREEREYWIAGSSLRVVDLQTNEVIAERIGYMVDWAQGSQAGGRSPWLFAADNACPEFASKHGALVQLGQTDRFVERVLKPIK